MIIDSPRLSAADRRHWKISERIDKLNAQTGNERLNARVKRSKDDVGKFVGKHEGECYCGVSWGKDSVVLAHIVRLVAPSVPLVWVRVRHVYNPDCLAVRDTFLEQHPGPYDEIDVEPGKNRSGGTSAIGFAKAKEYYGKHYLSGVRGDESATRKLRMRKHGVDSGTACAPLGWWSALDVFAYLNRHGLPVHPAYAMTLGGRLDRCRLRVSSLGGGRGTGMGRREWEQRYYGRELAAIEAAGHLAGAL